MNLMQTWIELTRGKFGKAKDSVADSEFDRATEDLTVASEQTRVACRKLSKIDEFLAEGPRRKVAGG